MARESRPRRPQAVLAEMIQTNTTIQTSIIQTQTTQTSIIQYKHIYYANKHNNTHILKHDKHNYASKYSTSDIDMMMLMMMIIIISHKHKQNHNTDNTNNANDSNNTTIPGFVGDRPPPAFNTA